MRQLCGLVLAVLYRGKLYWKHEEVTIDEADKWGIADVEEIVAYRKKNLGLKGKNRLTVVRGRVPIQRTRSFWGGVMLQFFDYESKTITD